MALLDIGVTLLDRFYCFTCCLCECFAGHLGILLVCKYFVNLTDMLLVNVSKKYLHHELYYY